MRNQTETDIRTNTSECRIDKDLAYGPVNGKCKEIYHYILKYSLVNVLQPTIREICKGVHLGSTSSVYLYLIRLESHGYIKRTANGSNRMWVKGLQYQIAPELESELSSAFADSL